MTSGDPVVAFLSEHESATGKELREYLAISRQALSVRLRKLIAAGKVVKSGTTRGAAYRLASPGLAAQVSRNLRLEGLDESLVYEELAPRLNLPSELPEHIEDIVRYAFTEMLNNAIDHSGSSTCRVEVALDDVSASFHIRDRGAGVFSTITAKLGLEDENAAMIELIKGRTTTMPEAHTGEGLFFTARVADRFRLRSHRIELEWDRFKDDVFVHERRFLGGTDVRFSVRRSARQRLESVFAEYAPAEFDYQFLRTRVHVKLLRKDYVSRSEAKRLLTNLEKFRQVELDFREVTSVGQAFADQVFRVFVKGHQNTEVLALNVGPAISAMLRHGGWNGDTRDDGALH